MATACKESDSAAAAVRHDSDLDAIVDSLESGCSLRERAHELEFEHIKSDLHKANVEWENDTDVSSRSEKSQQVNVKSTSESSSDLSSFLSSAAFEELRQRVAADMMGHDTMFTSPLEWKPGSNLQVPLVYCDFTASSRPLQSIEDYLDTTCIPFYGNTHTNTSITGSQSSAFVSEARQIIAEACNAKITGKASQDVVLFAGNGTTACVQLLIDCLGLKHYDSSRGNDQQQNHDKPLVILGPFEHHSNILPWRELGIADIETVGYKDGSVDLQDLERILKKHEHRKSIKIGSFSAASNVTGTVVDDLAITAILHKYGALSVWDYATGASYLEMNMNPTPVTTIHTTTAYGNNPAAFAKDAIFFSGHKLLGGIGTPGVLIVKKKLVSTLNSPDNCGGGTVFYVTEDHHRFLSNRIERYEGGTPNVTGIWRLGLVFRFKLSLKSAIKQMSLHISNENCVNDRSKTCDGFSPNLMVCDLERAKNIQRQLGQIHNLVLLDGNAPDGVPKVPVFSFLIKCGTRFLHYNYVCALLNDFFGIQSRGGCQCAGPYSQFLLGMLDKNGDNLCSNAAVEKWLVNTKDELLRPGATRLSLPTLGTTQKQQDYVLEAIRWIASNGWKMMHVYRCNHRSGEWRHKSRPGAPLGTRDRLWLSHYQTLSSKRQLMPSASPPAAMSLSDALVNANKILEIVLKDQSSLVQALKMVEEGAESPLRWYVYPKDVARFVQSGAVEVPGTGDAENLQGALYPLAMRAKTNTCEETTDLTQKDDIVHDGGSPAAVAKVDGGSLRIHFRDGEHTGEAPLEEIIEGFEDGELSDQCQLFDETMDEWLEIADFLEKYGFPCPGKAEEGSDSQGPLVLNDNVVAAPATAANFDLDDLPIVNKNNEKRPSRNSAAWGRGEMQSILLDKSTTDQERGPHGNGNKYGDFQSLKVGHVKPPPKLLRLVTQAMIQWDMLQDGDRLLLGLSGGKDSLSLLHILLHFQRKLPIRFEIEVCTIDPMTPSFDPSPLVPYVESLGLKYHYVRDDIVERASSAGKDGKIVSSLCAYCARMKRGNLYACARANNCNKLVLAQHLDDLAESFMMSVMHNGFLRTMKANYNINAGDLAVIRPLAYCREALMTEFARSANLPIINENCPACFEEPKERARMKKLLSKEETLYPNFYDNIKRAMLPLMHDDATAILRSYTEEVLAKSRKEMKAKTQKLDCTNGATLPEENTGHSTATSLETATDEDLVRELARRRAQRYRLAGAMAPRSPDDNDDPTGQVCSLRGGNGSIPCKELME